MKCSNSDKPHQCSVDFGEYSKWHLKTFTLNRGELKLFQGFGVEKQKLISQRSRLNMDEQHHKAFFLTKFEHWQTLCCNPFKKKKP